MKKAVDWNAWINDPSQTGIPTGIDQDFTTPNITKVKALAQLYLKSDKKDPIKPPEWTGYNSNIKVVFVSEIMKSNKTFDETLMKFMDDDLSLTSGDDPEVRQRWLQLAIYQKYSAADEKIEFVVTNVGR